MGSPCQERDRAPVVQHLLRSLPVPGELPAHVAVRVSAVRLAVSVHCPQTPPSPRSPRPSMLSKAMVSFSTTQHDQPRFVGWEMTP